MGLPKPIVLMDLPWGWPCLWVDNYLVWWWHSVGNGLMVVMVLLKKLIRSEKTLQL